VAAPVSAPPRTSKIAIIRLECQPLDPAAGKTQPSHLFYATKGILNRRVRLCQWRFDEETRKLLDGRNFATVATLNRDGGPQTSVVWIVRDGDAVLFSTTAGRKKARNLARDLRVSLTVFDAENPYHSVDIRGTVELIEDREKSLPRKLSQKYLGEDPPPEPKEVLRLIVRVTPQKVTGLSV
jgi:PPOX class probable F420-dependent enzyme